MKIRDASWVLTALLLFVVIGLLGRPFINDMRAEAQSRRPIKQGPGVGVLLSPRGQFLKIWSGGSTKLPLGCEMYRIHEDQPESLLNLAIVCDPKDGFAVICDQPNPDYRRTLSLLYNVECD